METKESLGYLKGLLEGLDLDDDKKDTKVFKAIIDVLENLTEDVEDITEGMEILAEQIDAVDEDLAEVEDYLMDEDECDCDDCCECDDDFEEFEVECPLCGQEFVVDEDTVLEGVVPCPNCGEKLEFEVECDSDDEEQDGE